MLHAVSVVVRGVQNSATTAVRDVHQGAKSVSCGERVDFDFFIDSMLTMEQDKKSATVVTVRPLYTTMQRPKRFRDSSDDESQLSIEDRSRWYRWRGGSSAWTRRWYGLRSQCLGDTDATKRRRRRSLCRWVMIVVVVLGIFGAIAAM
jgi:hypothetical protein